MGPRDVFSIYQPANKPATLFAGEPNYGLYRSDDKRCDLGSVGKEDRKAQNGETRLCKDHRPLSNRKTQRPAPKPKVEDTTPKIEYFDLNSYVVQITSTNDGKERIVSRQPGKGCTEPMIRPRAGKKSVLPDYLWPGLYGDNWSGSARIDISWHFAGIVYNPR